MNHYFGISFGLTVGAHTLELLLIVCAGHGQPINHYAIRDVRRKEIAIVQEYFAKSIVEVRKIKYSTKGVSTSVDGMTDSSEMEISDMFADK